MKKQGVKKLDYLILTHTDADHIGGADVIITKFDIDTLFIGDFKKASLKNRYCNGIYQGNENNFLAACDRCHFMFIGYSAMKINITSIG